MQKQTKTIIRVILFGFVSVLFYFFITKVFSNYNVEASIKKIPSFSFINLQGREYNSSMLDKNKFLIIIYFNSGCEHCLYETEELKLKINDFEEAVLVFVSVEELKDIRKFNEKFELDKYPNIKVLKSKDNDFYKFFGTYATPSTFIYDKNQQLIQSYKGEVQVKTILKHLQ